MYIVEMKLGCNELWYVVAVNIQLIEAQFVLISSEGALYSLGRCNNVLELRSWLGMKYYRYEARTSWPLPLRISGASLRRERVSTRDRFLPKSYKDFALITSCTVLRRMGTVPLGHRVPFRCHICHATSLVLLSFSSFFTFIPFGISVGIFYYIHQIIQNLKKNQTTFFWAMSKVQGKQS